MPDNILLVTGSSGLIGSELVKFFSALGWKVHGVDNNMRASFFGAEGDTRWNLERLKQTQPGFAHHELDIRDRERVAGVIAQVRPNLIVHAAAQPSHDLAASRPFDDFEVNALGTLNLLEAARQNTPEAVFVYLSTNKVYGDRPNTVALREEEKRWTYNDPAYAGGIPETMSIDQSKHSLFGASKLAADILVQEYGRYFGLKTCCLRCGCLTGPSHSGVELHGFLSYLVKCNLEGRTYKIYGYKGKQVRDNLHSNDVASFIAAFYETPRVAEIYNLGGGKANSCSIWEAFETVESLTGRKMNSEYQEQHRQGDHICYFSDLHKIHSQYPDWRITRSLPDIFSEIVNGWNSRQGSD